MIDQTLEKLGLDQKESKIYLSCLKLGPSPVRKIAEASDINRQTAYDILKHLIALGLVSYHHKDKRQYFIAEDPSRLKEVVRQRQQQLEKTKQEIEEFIPQLRSIYNNAGSKPVSKFYEGYSGVEFVLKDVIDSCRQADEKVYYVYSASSIRKYLYNVYPEFSDDRISAGIKVKVISMGPGGETRGLDERKWLTKEESTPTYILIYAGKVAMISVDQYEKPIGIIIEDQNIFQTQKIIFEFIWKKL
ncbi:MAG: helix-turn-helix domain-containing protein [Patescibacteria group bacterium]|jgi:sugar-specific transcriptional regulator TrmB|nr:helix-turn-helix domain-containing protein [Patescibacteria group bacterium]